jgi:dihydroorotate dehydrogenase
MIDVLYRNFAKPLLFQLDPETAHHLTLAILAATPAIQPWPDPPALKTTLWGIDFTNPLGLAAGMDKDATAVRAWHAMGLGFAELGTVTPRPQAGNPRPRMYRLPEHRGLINRLGFPSEGMDAVAFRVARLRRAGIPIKLALNFGPNKDTPPEHVAADYASLMKCLGAFADFIVINVSSPNTPGLRNWQSPERMREIFAAITEAGAAGAKRPPILIKLAPDLERDDLFRICDSAIELGFDGIVACNTTLKRDALGVAPSQEGGLSGRPLLVLARSLIGDIFRHTQGRIPIVGVGGVASAEDAYGHIRAGASMVELYTGLIYVGPSLPRMIKTGLASLLRRDGFRSIGDAIGTAVRAS